MKLVDPSIIYRDSFIDAANAFITEGNGHTLRVTFDEDNFQEYCERMIGLRTGIGVLPGNVSEDILWMVDDDAKFIGRVSIRHGLNEELLHYGGHIGYIISPTYRRQGYGTEILALSLVRAASIGLDRVLVTCDNTNIPSMKIIEQNGGIFEDERYSEAKKVWKRRYWIDVK